MTRKYTISGLAIPVLFLMNCASTSAQVANPPKPPAMDEAQAHFNEAATYYYAGRFEEAIKEYQQGLTHEREEEDNESSDMVPGYPGSLME